MFTRHHSERFNEFVEKAKENSKCQSIQPRKLSTANNGKTFQQTSGRNIKRPSFSAWVIQVNILKVSVFRYRHFISITLNLCLKCVFLIYVSPSPSRFILALSTVPDVFINKMKHNRCDSKRLCFLQKRKEKIHWVKLIFKITSRSGLCCADCFALEVLIFHFFSKVPLSRSFVSNSHLKPFFAEFPKNFFSFLFFFGVP